MCVACGSSVHDQHLAVSEALALADVILAPVRVRAIRKALDLSTPQGFDRAVASFAAALQKATAANDKAAVKAAIEVLDVDWRASNPEQRRALVDGALRAAGRKLAGIPKVIEAPSKRTARAVAKQARIEAIDRNGLRLAVDLSVRDTAAIDYVTRSTSLFVSDELKRRLDTFGGEARRIVVAGLERGAGRDEISGELQTAATREMVERSPHYWDVIAASFVSNGRSWSQIDAYAEAGISRYIIEAVLDEATTEICQFLDGKTFTVADALSRFDAVAAMEQPEDIKKVAPWVRKGRDADGNAILYVKRGEERVQLARVDRAGEGQRDRRGEYSGTLSSKEMNDLGVGFPPYHGLCRSTTVADV